jgi:hypothetical protein
MSVRRTCAALFVLVTLASCASEPLDESREFQIDETFSLEEQALIREYLGRLAAVTGQPIATSVGIARDRKIIVRVVGAKGAHWEQGSRVIRIGTEWATPTNTAVFAAHEMGHDLGIEHVKGVSLMAELLSCREWCWSAEDQAACERAGMCNRNED